MPDLATLREQVAAGERSTELLDDPDCLADIEFTFSVFRLRYEWGTIYEFSWTNHADHDDHAAALALLPVCRTHLETIQTDTMGVGFNGVKTELTTRVIAIETDC